MTKSVMKIFTNYVPSKYNSFDDQDPTWMNDRIKSTIQQKNSLFKQYVKNSKTAHNYQNLQVAIRELSYHITERKNEYNFQLSQLSAMTYWTILKIFYIGKKIPSLLVTNNQPITDFREEANFLTCTLLNNVHLLKMIALYL